jgi:hypothetical protein
MELLNARWDLDSGRTVDFRITGNFATMRHPFKDFTRKRGGRVGTRFRATIGRSLTGEIVYDSELMLADWQEKPGTGMTVKFWLDDEASLHPFAGCQKRVRDNPGEMFALAMMELTDDDQVQVQESQPKRRSLSSDAHLMVTSQMFVQYLREQKKDAGIIWDSKNARIYVKQVLGIESMSDLDANPEKAKLFHEKIRKPYANWNGSL